MKRWQCTVCGYIHEGDEPPDVCPICDAGPDEFELIEETPDEVQTSSTQKIVIIGNGAAGIEAARAARRTADDAEIHLFSGEPHSFYSRLLLTTYLAGEKKEKDLFAFGPDWFESNHIVQHLSENVKEILPAEKKILTENEIYNYDRLILCTGASPFNPYANDLPKKGVFTLRTLDDANNILDYLKQVKQAVIIGGGILGLEAAAALVRNNIKTTVLELSQTLMPRQLDAYGSELMINILARKGIDVKTGVEIVKIEGAETVTGLRKKDGELLPADMVLISIGIMPNFTLAEDAGLEVNRGILVNDRLQTSDDNIFAAGDVAEHRSRIYGHWYASAEQGKIAGQNAAGADIVYNGTVPSSILKVTEVELTSLGQFNKKHKDDIEIVSIPKEGDGYKKLILRKDKIIGAVIFGNNQLGSAIEMMMKKGTQVSGEIITSIQNDEWDALIEYSRKKS